MNIPKIHGYNYLEKLGEGNYGVVYKVEKNDKLFAMKYINKKNLPEKQQINLIREIGTLKLISKKNTNFLIHYLEDWEIDDYIIILMEYIEGATLDDIFKLRKKNKQDFSPEIMLKLMRHLLTIIKYLQENDIVHRDIKPGNIMFDENRMILIDFGMACIPHSKQKELQCSGLVSTARYMAPEVKNKSARDESLWSDIDVYSLGKLFLQFATMSYPEKVDINDKSLKKYPKNMIKVIKLSLEEDPKLRPTAKELLDILEG